MLAAKCQSLRHKMNNFLNINVPQTQSRQAISRGNHDGTKQKTLYGNYSKLVESSPFLFNFMFIIIVFCVCLLFTDMQNNFFIG
jgi:hypothetical protein